MVGVFVVGLGCFSWGFATDDDYAALMREVLDLSKEGAIVFIFWFILAGQLLCVQKVMDVV